MKRIAVLTSGGDAPGMNAAIRAVVRMAAVRDVEVLGVRRGFAGLIDGEFIPLTARDVGGILEFGGTILESARSMQFKTEEGRSQAINAIHSAGIEGLIVIGGNGSQTGALALSQAGVPVNGVASTIDNDLCGSDITIGVDTALNIALEAIDRLRTTASSHHRLFLVEVMGRDCGYLALAAGIAGGAEVIVTPERDVSTDEMIERVHDANQRGKRHALIVIAEGAKHSAQMFYDSLCNDCDSRFDPRLTILGHVQRGGRPTAYDRLIATRLAAGATEMLLNNETGCLIGHIDGKTMPSRLIDIVGKTKPLPTELLLLADKLAI